MAVNIEELAKALFDYVGEISFLKVRDVKSPVYDESGENAGIDLFIPEKTDELVEKITANYPAVYVIGNEIHIKAHGDVLIPAGVKSKFGKNIALVANNKSGIATKKKLAVGAQVIDSGYQGEIHIHVYNYSDSEQVIEFGQKLVQLLRYVIGNAPISVVDSMFTSEEEFYNGQKTNRGAGGFGSTGLT